MGRGDDRRVSGTRSMVNAREIAEKLGTFSEWLLIRDTAASFPLLCEEIAVDEDAGKLILRFVDDKGVQQRRVTGGGISGDEIVLETAAGFGKTKETLRFVPRTPAAELTAAIEAARLNKANEIAALVELSFAGARLGRIALNVDNGRIAQIEYTLPPNTAAAAIADVTAKLSAESLLASAAAWLETLELRRKRPVLSIGIVSERRRARELQKLHALLSAKWRSKVHIIMIERAAGEPRLDILAERRISGLWREKPRKLTLPPVCERSQTARRLIERADGKIDIVNGKHGETLRFNGLPFVRIRTLMGREKVWFGTGRQQHLLGDDTQKRLSSVIADLDAYRAAASRNQRHTLYRSAPEAWLESILRRNIAAIDANLIISPIYGQFRSAGRKIDLLALRRDGRLVIVEVKAHPDRNAVFQAAGYWRHIELQRRHGILAEANLFDGREIIDKNALVYLVAPAWSFYAGLDKFAAMLSPEIELWRFELHEDWRRRIKVVRRHSSDQ